MCTIGVFCVIIMLQQFGRRVRLHTTLQLMQAFFCFSGSDTGLLWEQAAACFSRNKKF